MLSGLAVSHRRRIATSDARAEIATEREDDDSGKDTSSTSSKSRAPVHHVRKDARVEREEEARPDVVGEVWREQEEVNGLEREDDALQGHLGELIEEFSDSYRAKRRVRFSLQQLY